MLKNLICYTSDPFSEHLRIKTIAVEKNYSKVELSLEKIHMNALKIAHGGALFSLADMAFAIAANYEEVYTMLNANTSISFIKKATHGPIIAEAHLIHAGKKLSVYQVSIIDNNEDKIAIATIHGYRTKLPLSQTTNAL